MTFSILSPVYLTVHMNPTLSLMSPCPPVSSLWMRLAHSRYTQTSPLFWDICIIHSFHTFYTCAFTTKPSICRPPCRTPLCWTMITASLWILRRGRALPFLQMRAPSFRLSWLTSWSTWATAPAVHKPQTPSATLWPPLSTCRSCSHLLW